MIWIYTAAFNNYRFGKTQQLPLKCFFSSGYLLLQSMLGVTCLLKLMHCCLASLKRLSKRTGEHLAGGVATELWG